MGDGHAKRQQDFNELQENLYTDGSPHDSLLAVNPRTSADALQGAPPPPDADHPMVRKTLEKTAHHLNQSNETIFMGSFLRS